MGRNSTLFIILGIVALAVVAYVVAATSGQTENIDSEEGEQTEQNDEVSDNTSELVETVAQDFSVPWGVAVLPDESILVTERTGSLVRIDGDDHQSLSLESAEAGEGGALGIALHPQFEQNNLLYIYMTQGAAGGDLVNRVERYQYDPETHGLSDETTIISGIPGADYHDGGRIAFGPDGYLYITTGDAGNGDSAQNTDSLAGKILRLEDDGSIPEENPFGNAVWSYGHRNPQGLAWDDDGRLWSTEHGRSGLQSGLDELNLIERGGNYGWPVIEGDETRGDMIAPVIHSGSRTTWAPASLAYLDGTLYWGGLRGETLYSVEVGDGEASDLSEHFQGEFGRLRTVMVGPRSLLYVTTSNTDGRGEPRAGDDVLLRVNPERLSQ